MFDGDSLLDLGVLGLYESIVDVAVSVQLGQGSEAFLGAAVIDEPTGGLGEEKDQKAEDACWDVLDAETDTPLTVIILRKTDECA
jgi:hypothetical protein